MTPHEALENIKRKTYPLTEECSDGYVEQYAIQVFEEEDENITVVNQALNRLQELELVNERLEKEIREVLKK